MLMVVSYKSELKDLPPELHWFCSLEDAKIPARQDLLEEEQARIKIEDSIPSSIGHRLDLAFECLKLFAYDGEDVLPHQEYLREQIKLQLGKCDTCIVSYYKSKHQKIERMRQ